MAQPIVFFDIAGPDDEALKSFYSSIFGWELDQAGQFGVPVATPIKGAIRKDPTEQRIYVGVTDVTATLSRIEQSGGTVDVPRFEVPGVHQNRLNAVARRLNERPRKTLEYRTPAERFAQCVALIG